MSYDIMNPILLSRHSHLSLLFVRFFHEKVKHMGVNPTLNALRNSGFWIAKGRVLIRSLLSECIICKKFNSFPFRYPKRTDYIGDRVNLVHPFKHTGVDFTSHFFVKLGENTVKMYLIIFTCLNIRAVHLELVPSMSTADFLNAFIKFCSYNCTPTNLYSDNASTFLHALKIINCCHQDDPLKEHLEKNSIRHLRVPVYSPWVANAWERLLRVVKASIYKTIGRKKLDYFSFSALLADVQNCINARPLTYAGSEPTDLQIVTPNSFLKILTSNSFNFENLDQSSLEYPSRKSLIASLSKKDELFGEFKDIWQNIYLTSLREAAKDLYQPSWENKITVGDVVLLKSPNKPRLYWSMGIVTELLPGKDGKVRFVKVSRSASSEEVHSISNLYPLELSLYDDKIQKSVFAGDEHENEDNSRPQRQAAELCRKKLRDLQ